MLDARIQSLLAVVDNGGFSKAAEKLCLSQPAVSYHIRQLEESNQIKIFYSSRRALSLTPEGEILVKYARRLQSISDNARRELEDCKRELKHFTVGITPTVGEGLMARVLAEYCQRHPIAHIKIMTDSIEKIYDMLMAYELDFAIVDGSTPVKHCRVELIDMDYLCVAVSPEHPFASRVSVTLEELKTQRLFLRTSGAGTRQLFESSLLRHSENIANFNVVMEMDNMNSIKALVEERLGVTVMAHSACREDEALGKLKTVSIEGLKMVREINIVCQDDFGHEEVISQIRSIYNRFR